MRDTIATKENADGNVRSMGRDALRESYGGLLAEDPEKEYEIVTRIRVGSWVVDEEHITGGREETCARPPTTTSTVTVSSTGPLSRLSRGERGEAYSSSESSAQYASVISPDERDAGRLC